MDIEERAERAAELKQKYGYNCCQAVTAVLADETGLSEEQLNHIAAGFAVGMGSMEATCGSLIGAVMIAGLKTEGRATVRAANQISKNFAARCGATICKELKGRDTGTVLCACENCVRNAVRAYGEVCQP